MMDEQYVKELKQKIKDFSLEDSLLRDIYLKGLADGTLQGPPVGVASIDKSWLKFYENSDILDQAPKMTIYENLYESNKDHLDEVAFEYFGTKITYKELFENIDKTAKSFVKAGVKKGDIVTLCTITTPEIIYSFYALNKIGAISNMIDIRYTKQAIEEYLKECHSKMLITLDLAYPKVKDIIPNTDVEQVLTVSPTNSIPKLLKIMANATNYIKGKTPKVPYGETYIDWNDFAKNMTDEEVKTAPYEKNQTAVIVHTGGTTGKSKGVELTNDNFNNATTQIKSIVNERGYKFLNIMPPFIAYGIVLGLNAPLTLGWRTTVVPQFDPNKFDDLLLKYKPNGVMGVPTYWENVMKSKKAQKADLSFIKNILLGGDRIPPEFETKLNNFLKERNVPAEISKGYSMTEVSAMTTLSTEKANELGSVGAPMPKTVVGIFEPGTTKELPYGEVGEICIKTPTMMNGYYDNKEETDQVKVMHDDGYWIHSGDIGYMNKDGLVFVKDRIKRMFPRSGFKVFPSEIENLFLTHPAVESCAVVGVPDPVDITAPMAHIVLKEEYVGKENEIIDELNDMIDNSVLPPYFKPVGYKFRASLPKTDIGKIDFVSLQNEANELEGSVKRL